MAFFDTKVDPRLRQIADEYRERLKANPLDVPAVLAYATALGQFGHKRDAISLLSRTGAGLLKKERLVEAMAIWKRVGDIDPKGEITASFLVGLELGKLRTLSAPPGAPASSASVPAASASPGTLSPARAPSPAEREQAAAHRAKSEAVRNTAAGIPLLKDVPPFLLELVLDRIKLGQVPAGTILFAEASVGSSLLFIAAGEVEVLVDGPAGSAVAGRLGPGDVAGEISFLSGTPRTATLRTATEVHLLELDRRAVEPILKKHRAIADSLAALYRERVLDGVLARSRVFGRLERSVRDALAARMTSRTAKPGEVLVLEGATDDAMFLIRRGEARVTRAKGAREAALAILGPHEVFGDVAALRGTARTATVTAVTPMELLVLPRAALHELLPSSPELAAALDEIQLERFVATARSLAD